MPDQYSANDLPATEQVATATVEGQIIMPFYVVCDVSGSMARDMGELNQNLRELRDLIMANPIVDDLTMLSVITFHTTAQTVLPLAAPSEVNLPTLTVGGATNYGAAFREFIRAFDEDKKRLKAEGKKVYRPCVFFLSDGAPTDRDYLTTFRSLITYDPETATGNKAFPYVVTFGFRDAREEVMKQLAYPDFGSTRGRWFLARSNRVGELLKSMASAIGNTIISSGLSGTTGGPARIVPPTVPASAGLQFGEAGDLVD
jgi:uncharacterized protein YegL